MSEQHLGADTTSPATGVPLPEEPRHLRTSQRKRKNLRPSNPLQAGIRDFLLLRDVSDLDRSDSAGLVSVLLDDLSLLPKRFTVYTPLLLLPSNFLPLQSLTWTDADRASFLSTNPWYALVSGLSTTELEALWRCLVSAFSKDNVSHIAIGAPIQLELEGGRERESHENILRSPVGIRGVCGDFGVTPASDSTGNVHTFADSAPKPNQGNEVALSLPFTDALWVQSVQNGGIVQVWAPMWTMFSRGNIKEKARILSGISTTAKTHGSDVSIFPGLDGLQGDLGQDLANIAVVDMYVGIGYFAFSYLKRGVGLVIGFELNPWSVEGLRRGAEKNGWRCHVINLPETYDENPSLVQVDSVRGQLLHTIRQSPQEVNLLVFQGDNRWATRVVALYKQMLDTGSRSWKEIRHVNLGLLPTSSASWVSAEDLLSEEQGGWVHVHENVEVQRMKDKAQEIERQFKALTQKRVESTNLASKANAQCVHIEKVKTYAPGIMHCVFDIRIDCSAWAS